MATSFSEAMERVLVRSLSKGGTPIDTNQLTIIAMALVELDKPSDSRLLTAFEACAHRVGWGRPSPTGPNIYAPYRLVIEAFKVAPKAPEMERL